jgi:hypothetical protein
MAVQATTDQFRILRYLHDRIVQGEARYCSVPTIRKYTGLEAPNQYILVLTDDLEIQGLINTRQNYQMKGGRLFQITPAGLDFVRNGGSNVVSSAAWTGRIDISDAKKDAIRAHLIDIRRAIEAAKLPNSKHANAIAVIEATEKLLETPDPLWPEIMRLLRSPVLGNVLGVAGLVWAIVTTINQAASN